MKKSKCCEYDSQKLELRENKRASLFWFTVSDNEKKFYVMHTGQNVSESAKIRIIIEIL
jgi:hypothetical protein